MLRSDRIFGLVMIVVALGYILSAFQIQTSFMADPVGAKTFPIAVAIETCPVDCIHYVHVDELERLEIERRGQNINFKARLVSQAESGNFNLVSNGYTAPQEVSSNMASRCNNCPTRGCRTCPMYGVGKNPEFERKEKLRKERMERKRLQKQRAEEKKSADL